MTVIFMAFLLAFQVGLAVWQPTPITIGGVVFLGALFVRSLVLEATVR